MSVHIIYHGFESTRLAVTRLTVVSRRLGAGEVRRTHSQRCFGVLTVRGIGLGGRQRLRGHVSEVQ